MVELTIAQRRVFESLVYLMDVRGYVPSVRELAAACGRSASTVKSHLDTLEALGVIERVPGTARAIRIIELV